MIQSLFAKSPDEPWPSLPRKILRAGRSRAKLAPVKIRKLHQGSGGRPSRRVFLQKAWGLGLSLTANPAPTATLRNAAGNKRNMIQWQAHEVAKIPEGYQVAVADVNGDGRLDILGLSSAKSIVEWYENPTWKPRPITTATHKNISLADLCHGTLSPIKDSSSTRYGEVWHSPSSF